MNNLEKSLLKNPILSALVIVIFCIVAIVYIPPLFVSVLFIIYKCEWIDKIGVTRKFRDWPKKWWVASIPMSLLAILNLTSVDSSLIVFDIEKLASWIFVNLTTGIFEELLLRGFCFYLFLKAWSHKNNAIFKSAIAQAIIFGFAHLINLTIAEPLDVFAQVIYATLFGIGFSGLIAFTKSLWLPIFIHTLINAASGFGFYFIPDVEMDPTGLSAYIVGIIVISLLCAIPGLFLLKSANKKLSLENNIHH
jgi:membrane protease YdiL (CAAX protease family)